MPSRPTDLTGPGNTGPILMTVIYMRHEQHGTKVAIAEAEARADEIRGWVRYTLDDPSDPGEELPEFLNSLTPKRRGRPPKTIEPMQ